MESLALKVTVELSVNQAVIANLYSTPTLLLKGWTNLSTIVSRSFHSMEILVRSHLW